MRRKRKRSEQFVKAAGSEAHHRIEVVEELIKDVTGHRKSTNEAFAELAAPKFDPVVPDVENTEKAAAERAIQQLEMEIENKILISASETESEKETETGKEDKMEKEEKARHHCWIGRRTEIGVFLLCASRSYGCFSYLHVEQIMWRIIRDMLSLV